MTRILWVDAGAGAAGDMLLGALLDAGAAVRDVGAALAALHPDLGLDVGRTARHGIAAVTVAVRVPAEEHRRTWSDVHALLTRADLAVAVRERALDVFARLARAEGAVHDQPPEDVHFHEVGAWDALADVVGCAAAVHALAVEQVVVSPIGLGGGGSARSEHGVLPVPAPAVLALLAGTGALVHAGPVEQEMCTPTGAALLTSLADAYGPLPPVRLTGTGAGAGSRDPAEIANLVRVVLGDGQDAPGEDDHGDPEILVATNVDDMDPRLWPAALSSLLAAGASDVWLTPILMKKGRPAHTLSVLCRPAVAAAVRRAVLTETTAIGLREQRVTKTTLERRVGRVAVDGEVIRVKVASLDGVDVNAVPEWEDVAAAAAALGRPAKSVLAAAVALAGGTG